METASFFVLSEKLFLMTKQNKALSLYPHKYPHLFHSGHPVSDKFNCSLPSAHRLLSSSCPLLFVFGWIAQCAQFPDQLNPPQSLVLLRLPANEQPFCAAPSCFSFLDELRNLRRMEISKMPTREKGIPWLAFSGSWSGCHQNGDSVTNTVTI